MTARFIRDAEIEHTLRSYADPIFKVDGLKPSAIHLFIVEDDSQAGPDHVDSHRSVLLVASPFAKRSFVDHTFYTTTGVLRTIELVLGLYFTWTVFYALANGIYGTIPFLVLFQVGLLYTGLLSVVQQYSDDDTVILNTQVAGG